MASNSHKSSKRTNSRPPTRSYPRTARLNQVILEVIAGELEHLNDENLELVTITGVETDPDMGSAKVFVSALASNCTIEEAIASLETKKYLLQRAVGDQVRLKRTPKLTFISDTSIMNGARIEEIIRTMKRSDPELVEPQDSEIAPITVSEAAPVGVSGED